MKATLKTEILKKQEERKSAGTRGGRDTQEASVSCVHPVYGVGCRCVYVYTWLLYSQAELLNGCRQ